MANNTQTDVSGKTMSTHATANAQGVNTQVIDSADKTSVEPLANQAANEVVNQAANEVVSQGSSVEQAVQVTGQAMNKAGQVVGQAPEQAMAMESAFTWGGYFQAIGTLLILLALLWGVVWLVRRYGRFNFLPKPGAFPRDGLRLESQLPLGPRKGLMVVRFLNKRLLLGVTDHQITLLKETADDDDKNDMDFEEVMEMAKRQNSDN